MARNAQPTKRIVELLEGLSWKLRELRDEQKQVAGDLRRFARAGR
jgi:hypothetical protein